MARRVSPMATPLTRSWRTLADDAIAAAAGAAHGERGRRVIEAAQVAETTPIMVRRAIAVRLALVRLEEQGVDVPDFLYSLPVGVGAVVGRWAARDPETAWRWAADYHADAVTFAAVVDAERAARSDVPAARKPRSRPMDDPALWRAGQLKAYAAGGAGRRVLPPAPDDLPVHGWVYDNASHPALATSLLVAGPLPNFESYMQARGAICVSAVGLARLVGRCVVIVPADDVAKRYASWLADRAVPAGEVIVETVIATSRPVRAKKGLAARLAPPSPA